MLNTTTAKTTATAEVLQGRRREKRVLNTAAAETTTAAELVLQSCHREKWMLNTTTAEVLQGCRRKKRVLNAAAIQGLRGIEHKMVYPSFVAN
jgi:hypothetical protein